MITLTEAASKEVVRVKDEEQFNDNMFLRIGVAGGGCSGFSYSLGFDDKFDDTKDSKFHYHGVDVVVDKRVPCSWTAQRSIGIADWINEALYSTTPTP